MKLVPGDLVRVKEYDEKEYVTLAVPKSSLDDEFLEENFIPILWYVNEDSQQRRLEWVERIVEDTDKFEREGFRNGRVSLPSEFH